MKLPKIPLKFRNVNGYFYCAHNKLTTLEGSPTKVGGNFSCYVNELTSLKGVPKSVGGNFYCNKNKLTTFEGLDFMHIGGKFKCGQNDIKSVWNLFKDHTKFEFFNDCDIIRDDKIIILDRLNFFLDYIGKDTVTEVHNYTCI